MATIRRYLRSDYLSAPSLVSAQIYIVDMRVNLGNQAGSVPVFIEVPEPVKDMTTDELESFVDEILIALEEKR